MTRGLELFELPPLVPPTSGTDGSVLLPTPTESQPGGTPERFLERKNSTDGGNRTRATDLRMAMEQLEGRKLLPTPNAGVFNDSETPESWQARKDRQNNYAGTPLPVAIKRLLPTPTVQDGENNGGPSQWERNSFPLNVVAVQVGENMLQPSDTGNKSSEEQPPTLL